MTIGRPIIWFHANVFAMFIDTETIHQDQEDIGKYLSVNFCN
jgi:hypothetical protein